MPATKKTAVAAAALKLQTAAEITGIDLSQPSINPVTEPTFMRDLVNMARSDIRRALKNGEIIIGRTQVGNLFVRTVDVDTKTVSVTFLRDRRSPESAMEIITGTLSEVAPIIAGLYEIV